MRIIHLKHDEIDFIKYDSTIKACDWGRVYAISWYLNVVSPDWEILAHDDYSVVMPLPVKTKYGFKYLTQPYFCQQLGVFSTLEIGIDKIKEFYNKIPYRFARLQGNTFDSNVYPKESLRPNYFLNFTKISDPNSAFASNTTRNLKKSIAAENSITQISVEEYIGFIKQHNPEVYNDKLLPILKTLAEVIIENKHGNIYATAVNKEITSAVLVAKQTKRIYYLSPVSSAEGKNLQSMTFIVNNLIAEAQTNEKIIDFEGSSIEGVARFYAGFGAEKEFYGVWRKIKL